MLAKKFGFGFGIAIILPLLVHYGVSTFSPPPKWNDYSSNRDYAAYQNGTVEEKKKMDNEWQRQTQVRSQEREAKQKRFAKNLYYVAVPVGLAAIIIGSFLSIQAIGAGLIFGGIFTTVNGYCWYWNHLEDWMRFLSLLVTFVVLIYLAYKRINEKN